MSEQHDAPGPRDATPAPETPAPEAPAPIPRRSGTRSALRAVVSAALTLVRVLAVVAGLSVVVLGFLRFDDAYDEAVAHRGAPSCGATVTTGCTRQETGRVITMHADENSDSATYELTVSRETAPTITYHVSEGLYHSEEIGGEVQLTLWQGRVVALSHRGHRSDNLSYPWVTSLAVGCLVGAGTVLGVYGALGRRLTGRAVPLLALPVFALLTLPVGAFLLALGWHYAVVLAVAVFGWLLLTTIAVGVSWDDPI
ncbi:hypothetical protein ACFRAR_05745 [Kitasatospora sp. NPDC056651]|uniref:hypothetical protein n=1 Tax=Kitasatospora sp. NPDC056651 TaxID=3345892 RepID=UPI0036B89C3B